MPENTMNQQMYAKKQIGATMLGMMFVAAAVVFIALIALKVFPAYQEYFSVKTVISALGKEPLNEMSKKAIQDSFNKRASIGYVTVVTGADLTIEKDGSGDTVVSVEYQVVKPLFGNISLVIDFETSSGGK